MTRMHLLTPEIVAEVVQKQAIQKPAYDCWAKARKFHMGQEIMCKNLRPDPKYIPGVIVERQGPLTYLMEVHNDIIWHRHSDHLE